MSVSDDRASEMYSELLRDGGVVRFYASHTPAAITPAARTRAAEWMRKELRAKCRSDKIKMRSAALRDEFGLAAGVLVVRLGYPFDATTLDLIGRATGYHVCPVEVESPLIGPDVGWRFCPNCGARLFTFCGD